MGAAARLAIYDAAMPETPQELYARSVDALRTPPVQDWDTWPFEGDVRPKALLPPGPERVRDGEGGVECRACATPDGDYLWNDARWRLKAFPPGGMPVVVLLEPRAHYDGPGELPDALARELGVMLGRVERAVSAVEGIGRVHIGRWGEGAAHMHWWFIGRPAGMTQMASSMAELWDEVLPPTPDAIWRENLARVAQTLAQE
jgi:diadenosine tetraphosphate (Ap4A) HIT family hydrolase